MGAISRSKVSHQAQPACSNIMSSAARTFPRPKKINIATTLTPREKRFRIFDPQTNFFSLERRLRTDVNRCVLYHKRVNVDAMERRVDRQSAVTEGQQIIE